MANNQRNTRAEPEYLLKDLRRDFDKRFDSIRAELKKGPEGAEEVERSLFELKTGLEDRIGQMRESIDDARESFDGAVERGRTTIKDRPLLAVGVAVGVGVLIGLFLGSRGKD